MVALTLLLARTLTTEVLSDIVYTKVGERELKLDLYLPRESVAQPIPVVVVIHGGAWMAGQRSDMEALARAIADQGLAAASIEYRLAPRDKWPAMIDDARSAVRFLRRESARYGLDPDRVGATGGSAGGHLALLLGLTDGPGGPESRRVVAVFNIFGPTDLANDFEPATANLVSQAVIGKPYDAASEELKGFSPITFVDRSSAPVFTIHGTADRTVPVEQARRLERALRAAGVEQETRIIEGMGHNIPMTNPEVARGMADGISFLKRHLTAR